MIDEFEGLTRKQEFNDDVFDTLRSLGNNGHIAYVTASLNSLKTLCEKGKFTSPFYNIFSEVKLGKFTPEETTEFLSTRSESFGFHQREIEFIYEIANHHPLHLQIACDHVFKNKGKKWDEPKLREVIDNEIKSYDYIEVRKKHEKIIMFIHSINFPATIASFVGFIILELSEIYPSGYNKHLISIAVQVVPILVPSWKLNNII